MDTSLGLNKTAVILTGVVVGATITLPLAVRTFQNYSEKSHFTRLRKRKQVERAEQFHNLRSRYQLGPKEEAIVSLNFHQLLLKLERRELKAKHVLEAYIAKALAVNDELNCVTEFVPQCIEWAEELDRLKELKGPLHGVPFCVKDDHDIEGMDSTLGCSRYLFKPAPESAVLVRALQEAGAVPFCKTNLPQTTLSGSSVNPIFGLTRNPLNKKLSPGGSSSGTGSLVGAGGAPFGLGSDIGGSIRIPANFCGIAGLKPTIRRNSTKGLVGCFKGNAGFSSVSGILAPTVEVLAQIQQVLCTDLVQNKLDPVVVPIPWNSEDFTSRRPLRIGYLTSYSLVPAVGDIPETVLKAKAMLEAHDHTMVPFEIPNAARIMKVYVSLILADGTCQINALLKNDAIADTVQGLTSGQNLPLSIKNLSVKIATKFADSKMKHMMASPDAQQSAKLWNYLAEIQDIKEELFRRWKELDMDVLLMPAQSIPPPLLEDTDELMMYSTLYAANWNILDLPAGVVPFGRESGEKALEGFSSNDRYLKLASKTVQAAKGMPLGVQIVGLPFQEETVLRVMHLLEKLGTS